MGRGQAEGLPLRALRLHPHPFLQQKCAYCCYYSVALERPGWLRRYLDSLRCRTGLFRAGIRRPPLPDPLHGGGTPSLLSPRQLRDLLGPLFERYSFCDAGERAFEFNPTA